MDISNPRRILAVSLADSTDHLSRIIRDLSGTPPTPSSSVSPSPSLAGTTHKLPLQTPYYSASIPIWLDLIFSPSEWASSFLAPEAKEVLSVLGGIIVIFALPPPPPCPSTSSSDNIREETRELITHVGKVIREGLGGWEWDGVGLGIGVGDVGTQDGGECDVWEDLCQEWGMEFVHVPAKTGQKEGGKNGFGEKMGISRAIEALQSNDWSQAGGGEDEEEEDGEFGDFTTTSGQNDVAARRKCLTEDHDAEADLDFGFDQEDFVGLKKAIWRAGREDDDDDDDDEFTDRPPAPGAGGEAKAGEEEEEIGEEDVQKLESLMRKLLAVRDMSAGLPEEQRKRIAKQAVGEVLKDLEG